MPLSQLTQLLEVCVCVCCGGEAPFVVSDLDATVKGCNSAKPHQSSLFDVSDAYVLFWVYFRV